MKKVETQKDKTPFTTNMQKSLDELQTTGAFWDRNIKKEAVDKIEDVIYTEMETQNETQDSSALYSQSEIDIKDEMTNFLMENESFINCVDVENLERNELFTDEQLVDGSELEEDPLKGSEETNNYDIQNQLIVVNTLENKQSQQLGAFKIVPDWYTLFECCDCRRRFINKEKLFSHVSSLHANGDTKYTAKYQEIKITKLERKSSILLLEHYRNNEVYYHNIHENNEYFKCKQCEKYFINVKMLEEHSSIHSDYKPFACALCAAAFGHIGMLQKHILTHQKKKIEEGQILKCKICGGGMESEFFLKCHEDWHNGVQNPFPCETCKVRFPNYKKWKEHKEISICKPDTREYFSCDHCQRQYSKKKHLRNHIYCVHIRKKNFKCSVCEEEVDPFSEDILNFNFSSFPTKFVCNKCKNL